MDYAPSLSTHPVRLTAVVAAAALLGLGARAEAPALDRTDAATAESAATVDSPPGPDAESRGDPTLAAIRNAPLDAGSRVVDAVDDRVLANDRAMHAARQRIQNADAETAGRFRRVAATVREAERQLHRSLQAATAPSSPAEWTQRRQDLAATFAAYEHAFRIAQRIAGMAPDGMAGEGH